MLLGLIVRVTIVFAINAPVTYQGYHGTYYNPWKNETSDPQYIRKGSSFPVILNSPVTLYTLFSGINEDIKKEGPGSAARFTYTPTRENPYLLIHFASYIVNGYGSHLQLYSQIVVKNPYGNQIGCSFDFHSVNPGNDVSKGYTFTQKSGSDQMFEGYRVWDNLVYDLSDYVDQNITIDVVTTGCSNVYCNSTIYIGFDMFGPITYCSTSSSSTQVSVPQGPYSYVWLDDLNSIIGSGHDIDIPSSNTHNYFCQIKGYCTNKLLIAEAEKPIPEFAYDIHCGSEQDTIYITNNSRIEVVNDTRMPDTLCWDFGDGHTSSAYTPNPIVFDPNVNHTIALRVGTKNFECDSIIQVEIPGSKTIQGIENIYVCAEDLPYVWHGQYIFSDGIYFDTLSNHFGCDSIIQLSLAIAKQSTRQHTLDTIKEGKTILWRDHNIEEVGIYYDTVRTTNGCDSIVYSIEVISSSSSREPTPGKSETYLTICHEQLPYMWNNILCTEGNVYEAHLSNEQGTDSLAILYLTVRDVCKSDTTAFVCEDDVPYYWHKKQCFVDSVYTDTLSNIYGCDSIVYLHFFVKKPVIKTEYQHICYGESYAWRGKTLSSSGSYFDTIRNNTTLCDSIIYQIVLNVSLKPITQHIDTAICENEYFYWYNQDVHNPTTYTHILKDRWGCDSIYLSLSVTHKKPSYSTTTLSICPSQLPFTRDGRTFTKEGTYTYSLVNKEGCDSIITLILKINDFAATDTTVFRCVNDGPYNWYGRTLTQTDTLQRWLIGTSGCDSLVTLHYYVTNFCGDDHPIDPRVECDTTYSTLDTTITYGIDTLLWFGLKYTEPGIYHDTLKNCHYCDSIGSLLLRVIYKDSVAVCNEDPYTFTTPWGDYTTPDECDCITGDLVKTADNESIVWAQLCVTRLQPTDSTTTATICEGESFNWYGHIYTASKDTSMTLTNAAGCDSICTLHLTVLPTTYGDEYQSTCTIPYTWHGKQATDGDTIILRNANGCDSIVTLHLTILAPTDSTTTATICEGETFNWYGHIYTASKDTSMTLTNAAGCDSICELHLTLNAVTRQRYERSICEGTTTTWRGRVLDKAGIYDTILYYVNGCDSIHDTLDLKIDELYKDSISTKLCQGESFTWRGNTYSAAGDYVVNAVGKNGDCDSILKLHIDVAQPTRLDDVYYACYNEFPFYRHGHRIELPGEYEWHLTNKAGCDSTIALTVYKSPTPTKVVIDTSFCDGTHIEWRGQDIWSAGYYQDVIHCRNPHFEHCDSIYLELHVTKKVRTYCDTTVYVGYCDLPYKWKTAEGYQLEFYKNGQHIDNFVNAAGCDSTLVLHVVVGDSAKVVEQDTTICEGETILWQGQTISAPGDYHHTTKFSNIHYQNCDSVQYKLHVKMLYSVSIALFDTICQGDTVMWYEQAYTHTGIYHHTLSYANGCDSVLATLNLTVNEPSSSLTEASMCMGQTYQWNGLSFTNSVDTTIHLTNIAGCDSACRLVLTAAVCCPDTQMVKTYLPGVCDTLMPYNWKTWRTNATKISTPGHYEDTLRNKWGCDSIIYTLDIDFYHCCRDLVGEMGLGAVCADDDYLSISLDLYSGMMNEYRLHFTNPALNTLPFRDTIVHLTEEDWMTGKIDIDIPIPYDPLDSTRYPRPDVYYVDILVGDSCGNTLQWDRVPFTVMYPSWIIIQRWNDVLALYNERYNGGYTFSEIRWFHEDSLLTARGEHDGYIYIRPTLEYGTPYHAELTRTDDGKTFPTCNIYPQEQRDTIIFKEQVEISHTLIEPNTTRIWLTTNTSGTYDIYDVSGTRVQQGFFGAEYDMLYIDFDERLPEGVYIIVFRGKDLFDSKKVIYDK